MSIAPVSSFPPERIDSPATPGASPANSSAPSGSSTAEKAPSPITESLPKQEASTAKSASATFELPQDVVEVHQDPDSKSQIIIQYLDPAKNVVFQVPSSQELDLQRAIAQEFDQAAKLRATESAPAAIDKGGKGNGD